jgi:dipeptidyl aminopeptidase/acylaminoacyl peptidase
MTNADVSEATPVPFVRLRNQPQRIYKKYEGRQDEYTQRCGAQYDRLKHRYYRIRYRSTDGLFVEGVVAVPEDFDPKQTYPTMIFNRGNWEEGRRFTFCSPHSYERWTRKGFVVFGPQYRGVAGGEGTDEWGGADVGDVVRLAELARRYAFVDGTNMFMYGNSRGGMMTYMALREGVQVNAAVVDCGVVLVGPDLGTDVLSVVLPADLSERQRQAEYDRRSSLKWADELNVPLLITHGAKDVGVPVADVKAMGARLTELGKEHDLRIYPDAGHCGENYPPTFADDVHAWVAKHLK